MASLQNSGPAFDPMDEGRLRRISTLVDSTFELSLKELRSFLHRECPDDPDLRAEVERRVLERSTVTAVPKPVPSCLKHSLAAGEIIADRYRITRLIGRGGMGEVYEARDLLLNEDVALKTLRGDLAGDEALLLRFHQEISIARRVTHPNVCRIFEVGIHRSATEPPVLFFAMELLHGPTLADRIHAGRLSRDEATAIAVQLADGLEAAHRAGIVHADFKSANVILVRSDARVRAVITDFGVARADPGSTVVDDTQAGHDTIRVAGTLAYMSPEQLSGDRVTAASDIYSFGIVLFEMACGRRPFDDSDLIRSAMLRVSGPPVSARTFAPSIDERWDAAINRCLRRDPARRFRSAAEIAQWFRDARWWTVRHWTHRKQIRTAAVALLACAAVIGGWTWTHRPYQPLADSYRAYERGVNALYSMTYETARKALEQSVAIDPSFALAHASLARAYDELDYTDRAKDSMLRAVAAAQDSRLTAADDRTLRALQFMVSRDYQRAAPIVAQIEAEADSAHRAAAALESGWLAQQMEDSEPATAAFERALTLDPQNPAARLRLGFMYGRRGGQNDLPLALETFADVEQRYAALGDYEGVTQTLLERASLLVRRSRQREALPVIEQALTVAKTVGNRYQETRLLLLQATALRDSNDPARATALVREAIDIANSENMDNLATTGQIDLANIYLRVGDFATAEPIYQRAVDMAARSRVRRIAARAQMALGSLYEQSRRPDHARPLIEAGLTFYTQSGYRRESVQAAGLLGGVLGQLGEHDEAIRTLREALPRVQELRDARLEAQLRERLADNLRDRGDWPDALVAYQQAAARQPSASQGTQLLVTAAGLQWRLGQRDDALGLLGQATQFEAKNGESRLALSIRALRVDMACADGRLDEARMLTRGLVPSASDDASVRHLALRHAEILIRQGRVRDGLSSAADVIRRFETDRLAGEAAAARLAVAEALVMAGERQDARTMVQAALHYFEPRMIWEAAWRGHVIAARASSEPTAAATHLAAARHALMEMQNRWTPAAVSRYLGRPDLKSLTHDVRVEMQ